MSRSMWIAASGMMAQQLNIDVISNNLANVNTVGYKKSRADFEDLMYQRVTTPSISYDGKIEGSTGVQVGLGVRSVGVPKVYTEGNINQTNNDLDMAIEGEGFFQVQMPGGEIGYTRAGNFKKNADGYITTADGYMLIPSIQAPEDTKTLLVSADGKVNVTRPGQTSMQEIGQLQIVLFANPAGLDNVGRNIVVQSSASGDPMIETPGMNGAGTLAQGYLEASNVDIAEEMIKMIMAQRAYEINSKAIQSSDELLAMTNNLRR